MNGPRSRSRTALRSGIEALEGRVVLSAVGSTHHLPGSIVQVAAPSAHKATTETTLAVSSGTLGQPITFTATVRGPASAGSPTGSVNLIDHGQVLATIPLSPSTTSGKLAASVATITLAPTPGGGAYFFGTHPIGATFVPSGSFQKSMVSKAFVVSQPSYTALAGGVKVATTMPGTGPAIQAGQVAHVLYSGYLATTGHLFDDSLAGGGNPLSFKLGGGSVIPGFDAGTVGMRVGETRLILIPPSAGYGPTASGPIPGNSTLLFVQTLVSVS